MVFGIGTTQSTQPQPKMTEGKALTPQEQGLPQLSATKKALLHSAEPSPTNPGRTDSIKFRRIEANDPWLKQNPSAKKILIRFEVGVNEENTAVLDENANKLVIISDGPTTKKQLFNNSVFYKSTGWLGRFLFRSPDRDITGKWDKAGIKFAKSEADSEAKVLEPLKHIRKALSNNEYKAVSIFTRNGKPNDQFDKYPSAVALIDSYDHLIDHAIKYAPPAQAAAALAAKENGKTYSGAYATDQYLGNPDSHLELREITHTVAEAFYQGHGFDSLTVHYQVHPESYMDSEDLSYQSMQWKHIYQRNDKSWHTSDDTKPNSKITMIRPRDKASERLDPELAQVHAWSQMSEGKKFHRNKENLDLAIQAEQRNSGHVSTLNKLLGYND